MTNPRERFIDFHAHILPDFDDGPSDCAEAAHMLVRLYDQGVTHVVSASHFYRYEESIPSFIGRRERAFNLLNKYLKENGIKNIPEIILGAEVYFSTALVGEPELEKLCIENTGYMLLELPYAPLTESALSGIRSLCLCGRIKPVLAHIERYAAYTEEKKLFELLELAPGQLNCGSAGGRFATKLIKNGFIRAIGTDAHNMTTRSPGFSEARKKLSRIIGVSEFSRIMEYSAKMLSDCDMDELM